jgi:hypothetical protein
MFSCNTDFIYIPPKLPLRKQMSARLFGGVGREEFNIAKSQIELNTAHINIIDPRYAGSNVAGYGNSSHSTADAMTYPMSDSQTARDKTKMYQQPVSPNKPQMPLHIPSGTFQKQASATNMPPGTPPQSSKGSRPPLPPNSQSDAIRSHELWVPPNIPSSKSSSSPSLLGDSNGKDSAFAKVAKSVTGKNTPNKASSGRRFSLPNPFAKKPPAVAPAAAKFGIWDKAKKGLAAGKAGAKEASASVARSGSRIKSLARSGSRSVSRPRGSSRSKSMKP